MSKVEQILELYYLEHLKQNEIAKKVGVSRAYVCQTINSDKRCKDEKSDRKKKNAKNRKVYMIEYFKNYVRKSKDDISKEELKAIHDKDVKALSTSSELSDGELIKWTYSAYHIDSKGNLALNSNQTVPSDMPKIIRRDAKILTQRYKKKCNFSC